MSSIDNADANTLLGLVYQTQDPLDRPSSVFKRFNRDSKRRVERGIHSGIARRWDNMNPMLMKPWGVTATLAGIKTETRRLVREQPPGTWKIRDKPEGWVERNEGDPPAQVSREDPPLWKLSDEWKDGDPVPLHYLRSSHQRADTHGLKDRIWDPATRLLRFNNEDYVGEHAPNLESARTLHPGDWHSLTGRFHPRWSARVAVQVVGVRAERLQDITPQAAAREGVTVWDQMEDDASGHSFERFENLHPLVSAFRCIWSSLHAGDQEAGWTWNPWVWVYTYRMTWPVPGVWWLAPLKQRRQRLRGHQRLNTSHLPDEQTFP